MNKSTIFLDMDGVLVNWVEGAHAIHRKPWSPGDESLEKWPYKHGAEGWDFYKEPRFNVSYENLFKGMHRYFWANLKWMPDGRSVLSLCEKYFPDRVFLLTAPHIQEGVIDGRMDWIRDNAPEYSRKVLVGYCKEAIATVGGKRSILIDDWDRNINAWHAAGGRALMCPRPWNSDYNLAYKTLEVIEAALKGEVTHA